VSDERVEGLRELEALADKFCNGCEHFKHPGRKCKRWIDAGGYPEVCGCEEGLERLAGEEGTK
jgi:hypothetical protein